MKTIITGGAGYIGSHTIIEMLDNNLTDLISIDNYSNSTEKTYDRIKEITGNDVHFENIDLANKDAVNAFFEKNNDIKAIIHFAAYKSVGESVTNPVEYYQNNIGSLLNILEQIKKYNIPNFVFSSSCSVYGNIKTLPVTELNELAETESPYAETKKMAERIIKDFYNVNPSLKATLLRYFNPVGAHKSGNIGELPLQKPNNLVPLITRNAAGLEDVLKVFGSDYNTRDGSCIRDYIHVSDIARAHVLALKDNPEMNSNCEIFNLGSGNGVSVLEMIESFEKATNEKINYELVDRRAGDVEAIYSDSKKAEKLLNWKPLHSLNDMMTSAWKWQQKIV